MKQKILLIAASTALSINMLAQSDAPSPPTPEQMAQHHVEMVSNALSLTSAQKQQASTIFTDAATSTVTVHDNLKSAHDALAVAVKNNDGAAITQAATTIGQLTVQLVSAQAKADAAFYQILTSTQQSKLAQLETHRPPGPGGPHGFGPPPMGQQFMGPR